MSALSFVIPTQNRQGELRRTLDAIGSYPIELLGNRSPEVIVIDNASDVAVEQNMPSRLSNGSRVEVLRLEENISAAARNIGVQQATGEWIVMLDDDSAPIAGDFARTLDGLPCGVAALGGEIYLPESTHEAGGLPEVVIGCGCVIRRDVFLDVGGYDTSFGYYAEESDMCAKLIARGCRITHTRDIAFEHRKVQHGRNFSDILFRLVRNTAWVLARHAPHAVRQDAIDAMLTRYRAIAHKENVVEAFERALDELSATIGNQADGRIHTPLTNAHWRRFSGAHAVQSTLIETLRSDDMRRIALVAHGKGADIIEQELLSADIEIDTNATTHVIATLSPGPMLDASNRYPHAILPWSMCSCHGITRAHTKVTQ